MLRPYQSVRPTQGFVRHDRGVDGEAVEQPAPLRCKHRRDDQCERLSLRQGNREGDVRLPQADGIGEERAAVARENHIQPLGRRDLVRREPRRPRFRLRRCSPRRPVEQRARRAARDCARRRFGRRPEREGERLRDRDEVFTENRSQGPGDHVGRARRHRRRCRRRVRDARRGWRGPPRRGLAAAPAGCARRRR